MKRIAIEEGSRVKFMHDDQIFIGTIEKKEPNFPLTPNNFWIKRNGAFYQPSLKDIIYVFPEFYLKSKNPKMNPSLRVQGGKP